MHMQKEATYIFFVDSCPTRNVIEQFLTDERTSECHHRNVPATRGLERNTTIHHAPAYRHRAWRRVALVHAIEEPLHRANSIWRARDDDRMIWIQNVLSPGHQLSQNSKRKILTKPRSLLNLRAFAMFSRD